MGLLDFVRGELLEIIEWTDDTRDTLAFRFPDDDKAIKRGAQLIVRESQVAQLVYLGAFADTFRPGKYSLTTDNLPILTRLKSWKYGFESPFKADVYFINTRLFAGNKWGTSNPIMMHDGELGIVRARAFGIYDFKIVDPKVFLREVAGSDGDFHLGEFEETMRSRIVSVFSEALVTSNVPVLDAAKRYIELGAALLPLINPVARAKYGIEITSFVIENVSVPPEVEAAIDKRSSMTAIGNLNDYVKYQMGQGMATGAGGPGGLASEMAVGFAIAQQMMQQQGSTLPGGVGHAIVPPAASGGAAHGGVTAPADLLTPAQVGEILKLQEAEVVRLLEGGELKAKKIGVAWRVRRSDLDAYLAG